MIEKKILDQVLSQEIKSGGVYKCFQDTTEKRGNLDLNLPVKTGVSVIKDNEGKIHITILRASGFWETELLIIK